MSTPNSARMIDDAQRFVLLVVAMAAACSDGGSAPVDASIYDGAGDRAAGGAGGASGSGGGAGTGGSSDGPIDMRPDFQFPDVIVEAPPGCPPAAGNEEDVGKACTKGGMECVGTKAPTCTCDPVLGADPPQGTPCFCTKTGLGMCSPSSPCGAGAKCCQQMMGFVFWVCAPDACTADFGGSCM